MQQPKTSVAAMEHQMKQLGGRTRRGNVVLSRAAFMDAAIGHKLEAVLGVHWVKQVAMSRARSERWSNTLILLFLMHAPVSQRLFYYFSCATVGDHKYLVQDYSIECWSDMYIVFAVYVVFMLVVFTFGLPLLGKNVLCRRWWWGRWCSCCNLLLVVVLNCCSWPLLLVIVAVTAVVTFLLYLTFPPASASLCNVVAQSQSLVQPQDTCDDGLSLRPISKRLGVLGNPRSAAQVCLDGAVDLFARDVTGRGRDFDLRGLLLHVELFSTAPQPSGVVCVANVVSHVHV